MTRRTFATGELPPFVAYESTAVPLTMNPGGTWTDMPLALAIEDTFGWELTGDGHGLLTDTPFDFRTFGAAAISVEGSSNNREYQMRAMIDGVPNTDVITFSLEGNDRSATIPIISKGLVLPEAAGQVELRLQIRQTDGSKNITITRFEGWSHGRWI